MASGAAGLVEHDLEMLRASLRRSEELLHRCNLALQNATKRLDDLTTAVERVKP